MFLDINIKEVVYIRYLIKKIKIILQKNIIICVFSFRNKLLFLKFKVRQKPLIFVELYAGPEMFK